ncbi:phage tail sheath subtilisin-like domain-containing protein [Mesorhizobium yinganensis]|uniref:phage tail sheath subtilisin-like domain-containing protein n=1 Tax=Mesorhizobium yinganensis TaxID=3157707 RepID=UPI0032B84A1C
MNARLTPGVYIDEVSGGVRPIEGVGTSTTGFIGEAARGIPNRPTFVNNFGAFQREFGNHLRGEAGYLAHAVSSFFEAGGKRAVVIRVLPATATSGQSAPIPARGADVWGLDRNVLRLRARGEGVWADSVRIYITRSTVFTEATFGVRVDWVEAGRSRTVETFDALRMDPEHEDYAVRVINDRSRFLEADDLLQAELDLPVRTVPPLPEAAARLDLAAPSGTFNVVERATLDFRWRDELSGAADATGRLVFPDTDAALSADEMARLLIPALGARFRVLGPVEPAALDSAAGPFDVSGAAGLTLTIDGVAVALTFQMPSAASVGLGAGPFVGVGAGTQLDITVDGVALSYTLVAGDAAGPDSTRQELRAVVDREFAGVSSSLTGGVLTISSATVGAGSSLSVTGAAAAALGNPSPAQGVDGVADATAVTAAEVADAINAALGGTPYEAVATGAGLRIVQIDMADHTLAVTATTAPSAIFALAANANGPTPTGLTTVAVEPAVATRAYRVIRLLAGQDQFDAAGAARLITVRVTTGAVQNEVQVNMAAGAQLSPAELAAAILGANGAENLPALNVEDATEYLTVSAGPASAGTTVEILVNGAAMWRDEATSGGAPGAIVDDHGAVEISVSEAFLPGVPRVSGPIFPSPKARGRTENSPSAPVLRPEESDDDPLRLVGGTDGTGPVTAAQYAGTVTPTGRRTGLLAFDGGPIAMLALPGRTDPAFTSAAMAWSDRNDVFLIVDGPGSLARDFEIGADDVRQYAEGMPSRSNNAAMFYPWVQVRDPVGVGRNPTRFMPPSGHIAGIYARTDVARGVWKAGAGIEAQVSGAIGLQARLIDADQDLLNPVGVNCLRQLPGAGTIVWGARTLAPDPEWRYTSVRRMALFLKRSLKRGLVWAVFEPNDEELWEQIRISINGFMLGLFQQGAFQGGTPGEAFLVQCDRETNPQELIDQGVVTARVSFAPLKPAEFVVVELSQKSLVS